MLRWNAKNCTVEAAELPSWWINKNGGNAADSLIKSVRSFDGVPSNSVELIDTQLHDDIYKLKCDIFSTEGDINGQNGESADSRRQFPLAELERIRRARAAVNPFEQIGRSVFINRAAVKLASIDAALGFVLSENNPQRRKTSEGDNGCLYFADLCGGPGGFSEYILWRLSDAKDSPVGSVDKVNGYGLTLRGRHDDFQPTHWWSLQSTAYSKRDLPFQTIYGPTNESDGDIMKLENRQAFIGNVRSAAPKGCGLVLADGGFDMSGREEMQETLISKLLAYEFACALPLLAPGGNFLCKLFDVATPVTSTLLYTLSTVFEKLTIIKPVTSRPANAERYIVCVGFLGPEPSVLEELVSLFTRAAKALETDSSGRDSADDDGIVKSIADVIPLESIPIDFVVFLRNLNNEMALRQKAALSELLAEARDPTKVGSGMTTSSAINIANECSKLWHLPPVAQQPVNGANGAPNNRNGFNGAPAYRPAGLASGGAFKSNNGYGKPDFHSEGQSSSNWRAQKHSPPNTAPEQRQNGALPNGNNFHAPHQTAHWKSRGGLADSVSNWRRQSPAQ